MAVELGAVPTHTSFSEGLAFAKNEECGWVVGCTQPDPLPVAMEPP